jgi:hypothetical protein
MQYNTGTVLVIDGCTTVTGTNTLWSTNNNVSTGNLFNITGDYTNYTIASIDSDTQITLSVPYSGTYSASSAYQIVKDFTTTLGLQEMHSSDRDWPLHMTGVLRTIDSKLGHTSIPQFGGLNIGTNSGHENKTLFSQINPVNGTWYSTGITFTTNEGFSSLVNVLYEDDDAHTNDRSCLAFLGGYNGGVCTPTYLARPNGTDITVQVTSNQLQVRQSVNTGTHSRITVVVDYNTHEVI